MNVEPPAIHDVYPESPTSPELAAVIMRCLRKEPAMRYRSMGELVDALLATPEPSSAGRSSLPTSSSPGVSSGISSGISSPGFSRPGTSKPPSALERSGVQRSSPDVLATSVQRPGASLAQAPTMAAPSAPSLADDPKRAVPVALVAVLLGALAVVGGWWLLRGPATPEMRATPIVSTPVSPTQVEPTTPTSTPTPTAAAIDPVRLVVEPAGARVRRADVDLGDAPLTLPIPSGQSWTLRVAADGYEPRNVTVLAGQGEVRISLERERSGGRRPRPVAAEPEPHTPPPVVTPPSVEPPPPVMREPSVRTDNRDPWGG
jgi:hypothetical protein